MNCAYLGERTNGDRAACLVHGECSPTGTHPKLPRCSSCRSQLFSNDPKFADKWIDPLIILDREKTVNHSVRNLLAGGSAFLVCGGPSTNNIPLEQLNLRGCWSLGVNNSAAHPRFRAQAFVCSDPPMKFSHSLWLDPQVMKFVPIPKMGRGRRCLRRKDDGVFDKLDRNVTDCPNVWAFQRHSWLSPDDQFFMNDGACWGNQDAGVERTGQPKTVCTMLLGLRLLYYLGARTIFLVGVDFLMKPGAVYSFDQSKEDGGCVSNNRQFAVTNDWLCQMENGGTFKRFGLEVYNTYERSGLRAFPFCSFTDAVDYACREVEQKPDLSGWYEKIECPKCGSWHVAWTSTDCACVDCGIEWGPENPYKPEKKES